MGIFMAIINILALMAFGLFILYMIIKTAVKHAIKESLEDIQQSIKYSIKSSLMERDWDKKKE